jgi:hypothetical protein
MKTFLKSVLLPKIDPKSYTILVEDNQVVIRKKSNGTTKPQKQTEKKERKRSRT